MFHRRGLPSRFARFFSGEKLLSVDARAQGRLASTPSPGRASEPPARILAQGSRPPKVPCRLAMTATPGLRQGFGPAGETAACPERSRRVVPWGRRADFLGRETFLPLIQKDHELDSEK